MTERPPATTGLHHVALFVRRFEDCVAFYTGLLGMQVEWHPDADNIYLTGGRDNLALHRADPARPDGTQRLDHIGFTLDTPDAVDAWHAFLRNHGVTLRTDPRTHRDGARSFYCEDPDGTVVQMICHPPLVGRFG